VEKNIQWKGRKDRNGGGGIMKLEKRRVNELKYYPGNPRKMSKEVLEKLKKSLREFGVVEPLVINPDNEVIGGNQRLRALRELGIEDVDVVVVSLPKSKEKALNIALNQIQGEFDEDLLRIFLEDIDPVDFDLTGLDEDFKLLDEEEDKETIYTTKIASVHYEPTGTKPKLVELYDDKKYQELVRLINESDIPNDIKDFLKLTATRFIRFNFSKIADFYAHSDAKTQRLFEKLALVIIDFNDALKEGLVEFDKILQELIEVEDEEV
jgi:hypothetical protein